MKRNHMKTNSGLLVAGMLAVFCYSTGRAELIYSNLFNGGAVDINGTAPTYISPSASLFGGSSTALWNVTRDQPPPVENYYAYQNGTLGSRQETVLLPLTPVNGYVYTLEASLTFTAVPPSGGWGAVGFAKFSPNSTTIDPRFNQTPITGNPWALLNMGGNGGGAVLYDAYNHSLPGVPNLMTALNTPYTIDLVLDTTGAQWQSALYVQGTLVNQTNYAANPTISAFGYGQTATTAGAYQWNSLTLSAEVPEPSGLALTGLGLAGLFALRRRN
jgi:PEP-CTERM motif